MALPSPGFRPLFAAIAACVIGGDPGSACAAPPAPGVPVDYAADALFPERWRTLGVDARLVPWAGERITLLTTGADLDPATIGVFLRRLDGGWRHYAAMIARPPAPRRRDAGGPTIAAVPDGRLTCGLGCGAIGVTGIEVCGFYDHDYPLVRRDPEAFPHYFFYEMGRNWYVFGDRHSSFVTGFAVFMRYSCMDAVGCTDPEAALRPDLFSSTVVAGSISSWKKVVATPVRKTNSRTRPIGRWRSTTCPISPAGSASRSWSRSTPAARRDEPMPQCARKHQCQIRGLESPNAAERSGSWPSRPDG